MLEPPNLEFVSDHIALWHSFDSAVKADLFSTALLTNAGTFLVDPISMGPNAIQDLELKSPVCAIIVTNQNHWRASSTLSKQLSVPILAHDSARLPDEPREFTSIIDGQRVGQAFDVIMIEGAVPGEIALFFDDDGGTLIIGDALINFEPYGFKFLPPKYCTNHRKMKASLRRLSDLTVERIFFAHGLPIVSRACSRLRGLLDQE
jgi:glyoxylase-like metal-dependent hydrolase (beta-lactamase superfamily II)